MSRAGSGSADAIDGFLGRYGGSDVCMAYIDANRPNAGIVEEALDRGFFCIGMFPGSSACDYIMMERTAKPDFRKLKPVPEYAGLLQTIEDSL